MQIPQLRQERELKGLTQKDLAGESGVSARSIAGYEAGATIRPNTARKLAEALGVEVADLVITSGKEPAPSSLEPSFEDLLEGERREALYGPWLEFVNRYADRWERDLETGTLAPGSVDEFISTMEDVMQTLHRLNDEERRGLPQQPYSFGAPAAKTGVAILRLADLLDPMIAAGAYQIENSPLERLRQNRIERRRRPESTARRAG